MFDSKAVRLLKLALFLRASRYGKTLSEIRDTFRVSHRTAERMRDELVHLLGPSQVVGELGDWKEETRWRVLTPDLANFISSISKEELAVGEAAIQSLEAMGRHSESVRLREFLAKIGTLADVADSTRTNIDADALSEARASAVRPRPIYKSNPNHEEVIESAILMQRQIEIRYREVPGDKAPRRRVMPVGILMDRFHYLCAHARDRGRRKLALFRMDRIEDVQLTHQANPLAGSPPIKKVASRTFGASVEETRGIVWLFSARVAEEASRVLFHPQQRQTWLKDGSLRVEFSAGGLQEMVWELFRWGNGVVVVEPLTLQELWKAAVQNSFEAANAPALKETRKSGNTSRQKIVE